MCGNLDGALACTRACYQHMAERGGGAIVNQSSVAAWHYSSFYGLAKVGINGLTQQLAHELGYLGIRVNAIAPGHFESEMSGQFNERAHAAVVARALVGRLGEPGELNGALIFLASPASSYVTGIVLPVDGGTLLT